MAQQTRIGMPTHVAPFRPETRSGNVGNGDLGDLRFRTLVADADWARLPPAVRRRFTKRLRPGEAALYRGQVVETQLSVIGRILGQLARLIGAPLPLRAEAGGAAVVVVTEDPQIGGQCWTRVYSQARRFPQAICSFKRFTGETGLEERVGGGIGMALTTHVREGALVFRSARYFIERFGLKLRIPAALTPGVIEVIHQEETENSFTFTLSVDHPWFGRLVHQVARFEDTAS